LIDFALAMLASRRIVVAMLLLTGLAALAHFSPLRLITDVMVQNAVDATRPVSLPDMAPGPADAKVTITEYASPTCPHCADFSARVFPKIKAAYIDTGKGR
jgi:protein-disulfide isomerase